MVADINTGKIKLKNVRYQMDHDKANILCYNGYDIDGRMMHRLNRMDDGAEREELAKEMADSILGSFESQASMNSNVQKDMLHIALSYKKEDEKMLSDEAMTILALEYMQRLGLTNTQYMVTRHYPDDEKRKKQGKKPGKPHVHLLINRVDNDGNALDTAFLYNRSLKVCREMKYQYGLTFSTNPTTKKRQSRKEEKAKEKLMTPEEKAQAKEKKRLDEIKKKAEDERRKELIKETAKIARKCRDKSLHKGWEKYKVLLAEHDIKLIFRQDIITGEISGLYFHIVDPDNGKEHYFSGSDLGKDLTYNSIQWAFDNYKTPAQELWNDIVDILTAGGDSKSLEGDMHDDDEKEKKNKIPKIKGRRM